MKAPQEELPELTNHGEPKHFLRTALAWQGSVTPQVLPRVAAVALYSIAIYFFSEFSPAVLIDITPFEYSGAVLGLLLVMRMNSGLDRWWEARKIWGSIVNQSRNLAIISNGYTPGAPQLRHALLRWIAAWPHVMCESLRGERDLKEVSALLGEEDAQRVRDAQHMPTFVGFRIAQQLGALRREGLDDFAFQRAERERALLIDAIGACERIRNTPIPLVLAIKTRRFIFLFLLLLPWAIVGRVGWLVPLVVALASYPLFSLDEIGAELQNPFSPRNLSHLPLKSICKNIERNVLSLADTEPSGTSAAASRHLAG